MTRFISDEAHREALARGVDVPEQLPSFPLPLNEVGISGKTVWVMLPEGRLPFSAAVHVNLPASVRGIHMSRIEDAIAKLHEQSFADLAAYGEELARLTLAGQQGSRAVVSLRGQLPCRRQTPVSQRTSLDTVEISADITLNRVAEQTSLRRTLGVSVAHITACPCTQLYNAVIFRSGPDGPPMPTHSQRSRTTLQLSTPGSGPSYDELRHCLEESLHVTGDLLKRPDEAELVMKSHYLPQFAEDAVRETARNVGCRFSHNLAASTKVFIESLSLESIHIHDVHCRLQTTLGEIAAVNGRSKNEDTR